MRASAAAPAAGPVRWRWRWRLRARLRRRHLRVRGGEGDGDAERERARCGNGTPGVPNWTAASSEVLLDFPLPTGLAVGLAASGDSSTASHAPGRYSRRKAADSPQPEPGTRCATVTGNGSPARFAITRSRLGRSNNCSLPYRVAGTRAAIPSVNLHNHQRLSPADAGLLALEEQPPHAAARGRRAALRRPPLRASTQLVAPCARAPRLAAALPQQSWRGCRCARDALWVDSDRAFALEHHVRAARAARAPPGTPSSQSLPARVLRARRWSGRGPCGSCGWSRTSPAGASR